MYYEIIVLFNWRTLNDCYTIITRIPVITLFRVHQWHCCDSSAVYHTVIRVWSRWTRLCRRRCLILPVVTRGRLPVYGALCCRRRFMTSTTLCLLAAQRSTAACFQHRDLRSQLAPRHFVSSRSCRRCLRSVVSDICRALAGPWKFLNLIFENIKIVAIKFTKFMLLTSEGYP